MPRRSSRGSSKDDADESEDGRKNPRRGTRAVTYAEEIPQGEGGDPMEVDDDEADDEEEEANPASSDDDEDEIMENVEATSTGLRRNRARSAKQKTTLAEKTDNSSSGRRTSSRANKFKSSMKEPSATSIRDLMQESNLTERITTTKSRKGSGGASMKTATSDSEDEEEEEDDDDDDKPTKRGKSKRTAAAQRRGQRASSNKKASASSPAPQAKSPAGRHRQTRLSISHAAQHESDASSMSSVESEEEDEEDEEEPFKIQRIIASRTEPRNKWKEICQNINTSEIDHGSRWVQEPIDDNDNTYEERFLVKWTDLSFLHMSWETQSDLIKLLEGAKTYLSTFFRKSQHGLLFSADERCDGDYYDPAWVQVDRILDVHIPEECPCKAVKDEDAITNKELGIVLDTQDPEFENGLGREFLIKWGNSPYTEATFEFERDLILNDIEYKEQLKAFQNRRKKPTKEKAKKLQKEGEVEFRRLYKEIFGDNSPSKLEDGIEEYQKNLEQHVFRNGGQLRDYQAEGVSWMMANFVNKRSSILADEMGLGKTIQTASFINLIATKLNRRGPFLIIAPLSTLAHWLREFEGWTELNTIVYHGSAKDREFIREKEIAHESNRPTGGVGVNQLYLRKCRPKKNAGTVGNPWMAEVVITTPELLCADDYLELSAVEWEVLVVDEAHRLKNHNSKLALNLRDSRFHFNHTVLLTGTPIQNTMQELFALLNFVDADLFGDVEEFMEKYGEMKSKESIDDLHEEIRPYILRRLKEDVEKSVPPKEETLIEVELTVAQKQYYRALYEKNVKFLHKNKKKALDGPSLNNLAMQLRKVCNHLFLLNGIEDEFRKKERAEVGKGQSEGDLLVKASGKLVLLDKLLPRLKENGHRILIFSQFKIMLDVLEDYLQEREFKFERIDGSITGKKRQQAIDRFQAKEVPEGREKPFIMLLSTRAGGVGINLTAADTCIIFDSDWNPQNDLQAQARCHRIGQTKSVKVYRLLTRKTYEMQMFHMSSLKMGLDQAVLKGFETGADGEGAMTKEEVERLLRHGAYGIFTEDKDGSAEAESNQFVQMDIDSLLQSRARTVVHENTGSSSNAAGGTFSKARFTAPKAPDSAKKTANEDVDIDDVDFWKKVGEGQDDGENDDLAGKRRSRAVKNYSEGAYDKKINESLRQSDDEDDDDDDDDEDESGDDESYASDDGSGSRERFRWGGTKASEWKKDEVKRLLSLLQAHGYGTVGWNTILEKLAVKNPHDNKEVQRMSWSILLLALVECAEEDAASNKRRAARLADKKREADGETAGASQGGVLAEAADAAKDGNDKNLFQKCFDKLWSTNSAWATQVLEDALEYARNAPPRSKDVLSRVLDSKGAAETPKPDEISLLFAENVWPSLKSRGWKAVVLTEGPQAGKTQYSYEGKNYYSPQSVLAAAGGIHTELATMVETLVGAAESSKQKNQEEEDRLRQEHLSMKPGKIDVDILLGFLRKYSPLQLLHDRKSNKKVHLPRRILHACASLHMATSLVRSAEKNCGNDTVVDKLSALLSVDKRMALPHPLWTQKHDAVLIRAIAKHGWIDNDTSCRQITNDSTIKWGFPFDSEKTEETADESKKTTQREELIKNLRATANRAAAFFNKHPDILEDMKGFNQNLVIRSYSLVREAKETVEGEAIDESPPRWIVDDDALVASTGLAEAEAQDFVELPTKKDLVRRAKIVLSRSSVPTGALPAVASTQAARDTDSGKKDAKYLVLDQSDRCNILLAEMLRGIIKAPYPKSGKNIRLMCAFATEEAEKRQENVLSVTSDAQQKTVAKTRDEMAEAIGLIALVKRSIQQSRQAKNVMRVMLGLEIVHAKGATSNSHDFPAAWSAGDKSKRRSGDGQQNGRKSKKEDAAIGDRALSRGMSRCYDKNGGAPGRVSQEQENNQDLELTSVETLIISVISSQGLPVWSADMNSLYSEEDTFSESDSDEEVEGGIPGKRFTLYWNKLGAILASSARDWHRTAGRKVEACQKEYAKYENQGDSAQKTRACASLDKAVQNEAVKKVALEQAEDYSRDVPILAKKTVMLIERLRKKMGQTAGGHTKPAKKANHWLGTKALKFLTNEIFHWAKSLDIVDGDGSALAYTAADFYHDLPEEEKQQLEVSCCLNKQDCRQILIQVNVMARLRSLFMKYSLDDMELKILKAAQNAKVGDAWESQPSWWRSEHDVRLLESLVECGFGGILLANGFVYAQDATLQTLGFTKSSIQQRANQLTRELHALEDLDRVNKLLGERKKNRATKPKLSSLSNGEMKQSGLTSFFSKQAAKNLHTGTSVVVLDSDDPPAGDPPVAIDVDMSPSGAAKENLATFVPEVDDRKRESTDPPGETASQSPEKKLRAS